MRTHRSYSRSIELFEHPPKAMQTSEQPTNLPDDETGNQGFTEWTGDVPSKTNNTAFFYGTLMHPKVIQKVIEKSGDHLEICIGLLLVC